HRRRDRTGRGALRRALSPTFRLARCCSLPLGGGGRAAASGAALLDRREPPIFASRRFFYLANSAAGRSMALVLLAATGSNRFAGAAIERAGGALRRSLAPTFRAGGCRSLSLGAAAPRADRHTVGQQTDPLAPAAGRRRRLFFLVKFRI